MDKNILNSQDTVVAPITPPGRGAVSLVRVSGPNAWTVASKVFTPWAPEANRSSYGRYPFGDDGLALPMAAGHGFTGEPSVELSVHGSLASVRALLAACLAAGARMAEPGEFTLRAFLNGRIDLTEAEGVRATVEADTAAQLRSADRLRRGEMLARVRALMEPVQAALAEIEARVDFEEELGPLDRESVARRLQAASDGALALAQAAGPARRLLDGLRVAIVGRPNVGKSSLLNALLDQDRAIVTPIPGTTRDTLEERVDVAGYPVVLIDTAGLRDTSDEVEGLGVVRARRAIDQADEVLLVFDASAGWTPEDEALSASLPRVPMLVGNKSDLAQPDRGLPVSALTRVGLPELGAWMIGRFEEAELAPPVLERHAALLQEAAVSLEEAAQLLRNDRPEDLASGLLMEALRGLGRITGESSGPDLLEEIFQRFCLGK